MQYNVRIHEYIWSCTKFTLLVARSSSGDGAHSVRDFKEEMLIVVDSFLSWEYFKMILNV